MRKAFFLIVAVTAILTIACKRNQYKVDVSGSSVKLEIKRLEKDLFTLNPENIASDVPSLKTKYGGFLQLFSYVLKTGDINDPSFGDFMIRFCTDKQNNEVYAYTIKIFPNVNSIESGLSDAFSHYRHYFPSKPIPSVYTCISGFNNSIITGDSVLGIGLDRYLGAACQYYPRLNIYKYIFFII